MFSIILVLHINYDYHECARPGTDNRYDRDPILLTGGRGIFSDHEYPLYSWPSYGSLSYRWFIIYGNLKVVAILLCLSQVVLRILILMVYYLEFFIFM